MNTQLNTDEWSKLDLAEIGWEGADAYTKDASREAVGLMLDAERHSQDGRSPFFWLVIDGDYMLCTMPQGDTLKQAMGIDGYP